MRWLLVLAAAGCGRLGFAESPDAAVTGPFAQPRLIEALSDPTAADDDPTVTADLLELYFESNRNDAGDIFVSRRGGPDEPWAAPSLVAELSSAFDDETPEVSADGLTIFMSSDRPGGAGSYDLYLATRPTRQSAWSTPVAVSELDTALTEASAAPRRDLLDLVFHAEAVAGGGLDLFEATRASTDAPWTNRHAIAELDTPTIDATPYLTADGLTIYFISDRPGGAGGLDLYVATRPAPDAPFDAPVAVVELNDASDIEDPWLSPDGRYLVLADNRAGTQDLYEASR